jgi:divalent metal cation (Fe/Co/Zn/Cd) transporter
MIDLLGDFVVLFSWRLSRRPPSRRYPFGLAKFETVGTGLVSFLLIAGALGIGSHSLSLLLAVLSEAALSMPASPLQTVLLSISAAAHNVPGLGLIAAHSHAHVHAHGHGHGHVLDLNAAWFAAASIVSKEWLFRITRKVADEENSPVLLANAYHHRSDAYSSVVALVAILGSGWFPALPLDPIGGAYSISLHLTCFIFFWLMFFFFFLDRFFGFYRHLPTRDLNIQGCI